jgi:Fe-S-cluster containining protein
VDHRRGRRGGDADPSGVPLTGDAAIDAGEFGEWLIGARAMLRGAEPPAVPCGDCRGCCRSSYFIPVRPTDTRTLAVVPRELLLHAPGMPRDQRVLGYREDGSCPLFDGRDCTIYPHRPQTCRDYDCRVFAAAGIAAGGDEKGEINGRVRAWRFTYAGEDARNSHVAVRAAAAFIRDARASFARERVPTAPTGIAVLALKAYEAFLGPAAARSDSELADDVTRRWQAFDRDAGQCATVSP